MLQQQQQHWRLQVWQRAMCTAQVAQPQTNLLGMTEANLQQLFLKHGIKSRDVGTAHCTALHCIEHEEEREIICVTNVMLDWLGVGYCCRH